jgi:photosystem II stability/assembly factor-like uncharacterized protein/peptidoglycan/xylan/chitin deacetylase (PgdA/CDA1 family)
MLRQLLLVLLIVIPPARAARQVAITIDDLPIAHSGPGVCAYGPLRDLTTRILAHLRGLPATAFVIGRICPGLSPDERRSILRLWTASQVELANHTQTHLDYNHATADQHEADILAGQASLERAGVKARFFRWPMLHAGPDVERKERLEQFLRKQNLREAPVTFDNSDWMFSNVYSMGTAEERARAAREYVPYMESVISFFEQRAVEVVGREIPQILLIHANRLNADYLGDLLAMLRRREYEVIPLEKALADPAYQLPNTYAGTGGFSWIHRWSRTKGMPSKGEPDEPQWLVQAHAALQARSRYRLIAPVATTKNWVVGFKLQLSGLAVHDGGEQWATRGYPHPLLNAVAVDPFNPSTLFIAAGNGAIRTTESGRKWKILTDHTVTELRDLALDPHHKGVMYFAHSAGVTVSRDGGETWRNLTPDAKRPHTEAVRVDRVAAGRIIAGNERGLHLSEDDGATWRLVGAAGFQIMRIEQSPHDAADWFAVTMQGGAFRSRDGGRSWENVNHLRIGRNLGVARNLYDIQFDPTDAKRIALCGYGVGVSVSEDNGETWQTRNGGLPRWDVSSIAFDPEHPGHLYASVHEEAIYHSADAGKTWRAAGLPGSIASRLVFVPEVSVQ